MSAESERMLTAQRDAARQQRDRMLALHSSDGAESPFCDACGLGWPCATVRAAVGPEPVPVPVWMEGQPAEDEDVTPEPLEWPAWWNDDTKAEDLHACWHDQRGNMLGKLDCGYERCDFYVTARFVLELLPAPVPSGHVVIDRAAAQALHHIASQPCENFHEPLNADQTPCFRWGRMLDAPFGAEQACSPCIVKRALAGGLATEAGEER